MVDAFFRKTAAIISWLGPGFTAFLSSLFSLFSSKYNCFVIYQFALFCVVRMWDIRPFAPLERCLKVFTGAQHNFEKVKQLLKVGKNRQQKTCNFFVVVMVKTEENLY